MALAEFSGDCIATLTGHVDVRNDDVRPEQAAHIQDLIAAQYRVHLMTFVAKNRRQRGCRITVIIRDEDSERAACSSFTRRYNPKLRHPASLLHNATRCVGKFVHRCATRAAHTSRTASWNACAMRVVSAADDCPRISSRGRASRMASTVAGMRSKRHGTLIQTPF